MAYAELLAAIAKGEGTYPSTIAGRFARFSDWLLTDADPRTILSTVLENIFPIAKEN